MPSTTGRNSSASSGSVRLDASKTRRKTPHDAARQVLDHHQRHRAERDAEEQQVGDQPGAEEVVAVEEEAERAQHQADDAGDERLRAERVEIRGGGETVVSTVTAVPPGDRDPPDGRPARRSPSRAG